MEWIDIIDGDAINAIILSFCVDPFRRTPYSWDKIWVMRRVLCLAVSSVIQAF
jgi:hypothetical protein